MTFKGKTYETIIDIERLVFVEEKRKDSIMLQLKYAQIKRNRNEITKLRVELNLQEKFVSELKGLKAELIDKIEALSTQLGDREGQIFLRKFVYGDERKKIMQDFHISESTLDRTFDSIDNLLEESVYGKQIKEFLTTE